jgi:pSer/pThr/pTyr-binding forkhead associated (FHA) protein
MGVRLIVRPKDLPENGASADVEWPFEFEQERVLLGRGAGADVGLPDRGVSTRHASIRLESSARAVLLDHGSTNGTRVNGQALIAERPRVLRDGDQIEVGPFRIEVRLGVPVASPTSRERTVSLARRILQQQSSVDIERPRVVILNGPRKGTELSIPPPPAHLRVGRAENADLFLDDADASREHAELVVDLDGVVLRDLGSKNGLEIGGRRFTERRLKDRDEVLIGATVIAFEDPTEHLLHEREQLEDLKLPEPTLPRPVAAVVDVSPEAAPPPAQTPALLPDPHREAVVVPPSRPLWPQRGFTAELAVLLLGGIVLIASGVGLYWLLMSS